MGNFEGLPDGEGLTFDEQAEKLAGLWTEEQIRSALRALYAVLLQVSRMESGEPTEDWFDRYSGLCYQLGTYMRATGGTAASHSAAVDLVCLFSPSWRHFSGSPAYPVWRGASDGWVDPEARALRKSLASHCTNGLEAALEKLKA